jgi:hypothetical protein
MDYGPVPLHWCLTIRFKRCQVFDNWQKRSAKSAYLCPVMRCVTIVLIFYATSMVCHGSLEMVHDLLHYLAEHHHSTLHDHDHGHHHTVHDHEHHHHHHAEAVHHHDEDSEEDQSRSSRINFFLFIQRKPVFVFANLLILRVFSDRTTNIKTSFLLPPTPPPKLA